MNASFSRRLMTASAIVIGGGFVTIVVLIALFTYATYVSSLNRDVGDSLSEARMVLDTGGTPPDDALLAAHRLTEHYFNPQMRITLLDQHRRVDIFRRSQGVPYTYLVSARNSVVDGAAPNTLAARSLIALATLLGLEPNRAVVGPLLIAVRIQESALAVAVMQSLPLLALAIACAIALSIACSRILVLQALRPLDDVTHALERLARGDLATRAVPSRRDHQLWDLTQAFNGAIAQVQSAIDERDEAHAAMRRFIADAGHQLRTPLTVIRGFIGILIRGSLRDPDDYPRILTSMNRQCVALGSSIEKLILLDAWDSVDDPAGVGIVDCSQLLEDVVTPIVEANPAEHIILAIEPGALARIDPVTCAHAFTNLLDNAVKYAPGSVISIRLQYDDQTIRVDVSDDGPGMATVVADRIFDRFYRGALRRDVPGSGLGLPIARSAIERAGGELTVESADGRGSRFTIRLPRVIAETASVSEQMLVRTGASLH